MDFCLFVVNAFAGTSAFYFGFQVKTRISAKNFTQSS
jgi:hypothetical protein